MLPFPVTPLVGGGPGGAGTRGAARGSCPGGCNKNEDSCFNEMWGVH